MRRFLFTLIAVLALIDIAGAAQLWLWWQQRREQSSWQASDGTAPVSTSGKPLLAPARRQGP